MEKQVQQDTLTDTLMFKKHYKITGRVFAITILCSIILFVPAYLLDNYFGTKPIILISTVVVGFPIIQLVVFNRIRKYANKEVLKRKLNQK
jgi:F0F1-type ATP synthase assembly protein I